MIDQAKIYVKAGDGGSGCKSFKGVKFTRSRRPDGGYGGQGADVLIRVDSNIRTLEHFQYKREFRAENAKQGSSNKKKGADARPCLIRVPPGTVVRDFKNDLLLRDLVQPNEQLLVAKGGAGGRGNSKEKSQTEGWPGEERHLSLELKLVADVGIIGYPNSGKSSLLAKITKAKPKIAAYPFTTTAPFLGALELPDFSEPDSLTIVELPALVKGSHDGKGLGAQFLRHSERVRVLIHLIDISGQEQESPLTRYQDLNRELATYQQNKGQKPQVLVANKIDLPGASANLDKFAEQVKVKVYPVSVLNDQGIPELIQELRNYFP